MRKFIMTAVLAVGLVGCTTPALTYADTGFQAVQAKDWVRAEHDLKIALQENPSNPYALLNLGWTYQNTNRPADARAAYEKLIASNSDATAAAVTEGQPGRKLTDMAKDNLKSLQQ